MSRDPFSCFWPRAIIAITDDVEASNPGIGRAIAASPVAGFAAHTNHGWRIDITHAQQVLGPPMEIANRLCAAIAEAGLPLPPLGVAGDALVAAYAARYHHGKTVRVVAPWESRACLAHEPIDHIACLVPAVSATMARAGIRTGADLAGLPQRLVQRYFGDTGLDLWRACRGAGGASVPEVACRFDAVSCRVVLPPRTVSRRSIDSHVTRASGAFLKALRRIQRPARRVFFTLRDERRPDGVETDMILPHAYPRLCELVGIIGTVMASTWTGVAVTGLEIRSANLPSAGGQLELFATP